MGLRSQGRRTRNFNLGKTGGREVSRKRRKKRRACPVVGVRLAATSLPRFGVEAKNFPLSFLHGLFGQAVDGTVQCMVQRLSLATSTAK